MAKDDETPAEAEKPRPAHISRENLGGPGLESALPLEDTNPSEDLGQDQVQAKVDVLEDHGYLGSVPDPTPNHAYTVPGVLAGVPTPETDPAAARAAANAQERNPTKPAKKEAK